MNLVTTDWFPTYDPVRSTHDRMRIPPEFEHVPVNLGKLMRTRYQAGQAIQGTVSQPRFDNPQLMSAQEHLVEGAFQCGIANRAGGERAGTLRDAVLGCCATKHFVHGLSRIDPTARKMIQWEVVPHEGLARLLTGSMAEARMAATLAEAGLQAYATTIEEDLNLGIDLLCPFLENQDGSTAVFQGMAIQVKAVRDHSGPLLTLLDIGTDGPDNPCKTTREQTVQKVGALNRALGIRYHPVIATVGCIGDDRFSFHDPAEIEFIQTFVRDINQPKKESS